MNIHINSLDCDSVQFAWNVVVCNSLTNYVYKGFETANNGIFKDILSLGAPAPPESPLA